MSAQNQIQAYKALVTLVQKFNFSLLWCWHIEGERIRRVCRNDWQADQFEILTEEEFENLESIGISMRQSEED